LAGSIYGLNLPVLVYVCAKSQGFQTSFLSSDGCKLSIIINMQKRPIRFNSVLGDGLNFTKPAPFSCS